MCFTEIKPLPGASINPLHPLSKNIKGYWIFNEGNGNSVYDLSGNNNHGKLINRIPNNQNLGWSSSKYGYGLKFNATNFYINCGNSKTLDITNKVTIAFWMKMNQTAISRSFFTKGITGNVVNYGLSTGAANTVLRFRYGIDQHLDSTVPHGYVSGEWHHIGISVDTISNLLKFYSDGTQLGNNVPFPGSLTPNIEDLLIGDGADGNFDGIIDEISIYNNILSYFGLKQLYINSFIRLQS